jgi:hypothetical protein
MRVLVLLLFILSACGPTWHLKQSEKHRLIAIAKGAKIKADTVFRDRIVITEKHVMDSNVQFRNLYDTVVVEKNKVLTKIKIDTLHHNIYVHTECPSDTIKIRVPVSVNDSVNAGYTTWQLIGAGFAGLILAGLAIGIYIWLRIRKQQVEELKKNNV